MSYKYTDNGMETVNSLPEKVIKNQNLENSSNSKENPYNKIKITNLIGSNNEYDDDTNNLGVIDNAVRLSIDKNNDENDLADNMNNDRIVNGNTIDGLENGDTADDNNNDNNVNDFDRFNNGIDNGQLDESFEKTKNIESDSKLHKQKRKRSELSDSSASSPTSPTSNTPVNDNSEEISRRRMIACKRCHSLKVKCVPVDSSIAFGPCTRCFKKNHSCEYNLITKKKKSSPITNTMKLKIQSNEIEKLKDELKEKDRLIKFLRGFTDKEEANMASEVKSDERLKIYDKEIQNLETLLNDPNSKNSTQFVLNSEMRVQLAEDQLPSLDIIKSNILTYSQCLKLLNIFIEKVHKRFPLIDLPKNTDFEYLRKDEPLLLVVMIYIAIIADPEPSDISVGSQLQLECLISKSLASEILLIGNKNIQLLKSTLMYSLWYAPPEFFQHRRYHMFCSLCVSMAHDLGISGKPYFFYNKGDRSVKKATITNDDKRLDLKALVLVVYLVYLSISLFLKRIVFLQWTDFLDQCCILLEDSNLNEYKMIALYARMNNVMERIYSNIHQGSDHLTVLELSTKGNKLQLADYSNQLNILKRKILVFEKIPIYYNSLMAYFYSVQAYLYEPAIQTLIKSKEYITPEYKTVFYSTLSRICEYCILSLKHFNELTIDDMAVMPLFHTCRILYTSGILLRIRYLSVTIPKSSRASLFTEESISIIKILAAKIENTTKLYPKNHLIKKIRIVLGLFVHTCLNNWNISYKTLSDEINNMKEGQNFKINKADNTGNINDIVTIPPGFTTNTFGSRKVWNDTNRLATNNNKPNEILSNTNNNTDKNIPYNINRYNPIIGQSPIPVYPNITSSAVDSLLQLGTGSNLNVGINNNNNTSTTKIDNNISINTSSTKDDNNIPINTPGISELNYNSIGGINSINVNNLSNINDIGNLNNEIGIDDINNFMANTDGSENCWDFQYRAFNDEFWSDLFFGDNTENEGIIQENNGNGESTENITNPQILNRWA